MAITFSNPYDVLRDIFDFNEFKPQQIEKVEVVKTNGNDSDFDQNDLPYLIITCVAKLDHGVGKNLLAEMLFGSKSKKIVSLKLNKNPYYNQLSKFSKNQILNMIIQMIEKKYLGVTQQSKSTFSRPVLIATEKGRSTVAFKEDISIDLPVDSEKSTFLQSATDDDLYEMLRNYRTKVASNKKISPCYVFHDITLISIAKEKPDNIEDLRKIKGIGEAKLEQYGEDLIEIVTADLHSEAIETHEFTTNNREHNLNPSQTNSQNENREQKQ